MKIIEILTLIRPNGGLYSLRLGREVGLGRNSKGYNCVSVKTDHGPKTLLTHRVLWYLFHKKWPDGQIDHINGDKNDNRIENLRVVSDYENKQNRVYKRKDAGLPKGIFRSKGKHRTTYWVNISVDGVKHFSPRFKELSHALTYLKTLKTTLKGE